MGVDLIGHGGASFTWDAWRSCLEIAIWVGTGGDYCASRLP
jgi:hypothetical protein